MNMNMNAAREIVTFYWNQLFEFYMNCTYLDQLNVSITVR